MIEVKNVTKSFDDKTVLHDVSCTFETGKTKSHYRSERIRKDGAD